MNKAIQIQKINPWWIRFLLLVLIGIPSFSSLPISILSEHNIIDIFLEPNSPLIPVFSWLSYAVFIWLFILLFSGLPKLIEFLTVASVFGIAIVLFKSTLGKLPFISGDASSIEINVMSIVLLIKILTMIPYALLSVHSFSFTAIMIRISDKATKGGKVLLHLAIFLRSFQFTIEKFTSLLTVWTEENPKRISPRYKLDLRGNLLVKMFKYLDWIRNAAFSWVISSLINTLEVVPVLVEQTNRISKHESNEKQ